MDIKSLLHLLKENDVRFVIIGGIACVAHGFDRLTKDIDIFVEPTKENMQRTFKALTTLGYDLTDVTVEEALQKKLLFRQYILRTDIHPSASGVDFETLWKNKELINFKGEDVYFASIEDLIKMKKAAGRDVDLKDLKYLEEVQKQLSQKKKS